jgi:hypothetical protein
MRPVFDLSMLILTLAALALAVVAYIKNPGLPLIGARNGLSFLSFMLPRMVPALILAGMVQVVLPQEFVSRHFGRQGGLRATPGWPWPRWWPT